MTAPAVYEAFGLRISSDLELPLRPGGAGRADLVLRGEPAGTTPAVALDAADPRAVAFYEAREGPWYVAVAEADGYRIRFRDCGEFAVGGDLATVRWLPDPSGARTDLLPILFTGTVLALILTLRGRLVLHASAVADAGRALAFVGQSGRGKSTLAALVAAGGGRLVTDDVLVVDADGTPPVRCRGNGSEIRLRPAARELASAFAAEASRRETADQRLAVQPEEGERSWVDLAAIVVPRPSRTATAVQARLLAAGDALVWLLSFPRVHGLRPPAILRRQFDALSRLVRSVPVYDVDVPWGPPFGPEVRSSLLDLLAR